MSTESIPSLLNPEPGYPQSKEVVDTGSDQQ